MKSIIALLLVACLAVSVYGQLPGGSVGAARAGISPAMIQALSRGGSGGMNNLFTLSAMSGNMGDGMRDYALCNMLMRGRSNLLCLSTMMA